MKDDDQDSNFSEDKMDINSQCANNQDQEMEDLGLFIESSLKQSEEELISLKQKIKTEAEHVRSI